MTAEIRQYLDFLLRFQEGQIKNKMKAPARFMVEHGREFEFGPDSFDSEKGEPKECYANAGRQALEDSGVTYVEGYVNSIIPIEHAWLVDNETGRVVETTLQSGDHIKGYFGVPIKTEYLRETVLRTQIWGVFGWWNWKKVLSDDPADIILRDSA
jgi:hypothetical protein